VIAVDRAIEMFFSVWSPVTTALKSHRLNAQWLDLPLRSGTFDLICGDGCNPSLSFPSAARASLQEFHRVLRPGGVLALRLFLRPDHEVRSEDLVTAAARGEIGTFHGFKIRLAMALQRDPAAGVRLRDVWNEWNRLVPDSREFERSTGWPAATIATIDSYRDATATYAFPSLAEWRDVVPEDLEEILHMTPSYDAGTGFPTLIYRAR
jgi:SAM-dependent methyltransferase